MAGQVLSVPGFGGGIVLEGSSDAQRVDELTACDGYDIGPRGQLVAASDITPYVDATGSGDLDLVYALHPLPAPQLPQMLYVGDEAGATFIGVAELNGTVFGGVNVGGGHVARYVVTFATLPYVFGGEQTWLTLAALSARQAFPTRQGIGLYVVVTDPSAGPAISVLPISAFDALGTGPDGEFSGGSNSQQLFPRLVLAYNGHILLAGFDSSDAATGDGPNRVMFSNINQPLKYGFDAAEDDILSGDADPSDRAFVDSDAILIGGAGVIVRAMTVWAQRAWVGTNEGLYFIEGYGRDSFKNNGASPVAGTQNVVGPHALIEGPDRLLHGVGDNGHWTFDGAETTDVGAKLRDFSSKSFGYWDLIWTDPFRTLASYPGQTNQDLVWMMADNELGQVLIGIPYCNATVGWGAGSDTVVLKYHVKTGGYTRQVFTGKIILSAAQFRREHTADKQRFFGGTATLGTLIAKYREKASPADSPVLASPLPDVTFGEYAPFGPNGVGVMRKRYLTIAWEVSFAIPTFVFSIMPTIDGQAMASAVLTISPNSPASPQDGDRWVDTSGTDTNIGNGTAGDIVRANSRDYLVKVWKASFGKWMPVGGGAQGTRVTVPITLDYARGSRLKVRVQCTAADHRFQIENFSEDPTAIRADA